MINFVLIVILLVSLYTDLKNRKILNIVTLPGIVIGFMLNLYISGLEGFLFSGKGFLLGFGLFLIPFLRGGIGAGDVKLMAAIGAMKGATFVFHAFLYTAIIGGLISLFLIVKKMGLTQSFRYMFFTFALFGGNAGTIQQSSSKDMSFPYGIAICIGTIMAIKWGSLL
ncbi:prepilin peptidase CpaA [Bacillus mesophilus]|uniref:Prepilin peptidase n=1 Tax=Bacillus mesophilus TaxID=1808955 RepID=A0A6M0Q7I2_9BACI|nr:A24 family peptidase [Bacillus mesophilus]MBM7661638.1 prepilin peptidase CpaA [Bacillus mesophilus]NEY72306.1 prepilin peptidase [Bacillus mesophilus]